MGPLPPEHWYFALAGWTLLLVLWETTILALMLAWWRHLRPACAVGSQHRAVWLTLGAVVLAAATTPLLMLPPAAGAPPTPLVMASEQPVALLLLAAPVQPPGADVAGAAEWWAFTATWLGLVWHVGAALLLVRLAMAWAAASPCHGANCPVSTESHNPGFCSPGGGGGRTKRTRNPRS